MSRSNASEYVPANTDIENARSVNQRKDINTEIPMGLKRGRRTDSVSEPIFLNVVRVPNFFWEVRCPFVDVDKLDKFGIEMWITKRAIGHERIVEVLRLIRISFQSVELCKLGLKSYMVRNTKKIGTSPALLR